MIFTPILYKQLIAIRLSAPQFKICMCNCYRKLEFMKQMQHNHRIQPATYRKQNFCLRGYAVLLQIFKKALLHKAKDNFSLFLTR